MSKESRQNFACMALAFELLVLFMVIIERVNGAGWHDSSDGLTVWPSTNVPVNTSSTAVKLPGFYYQPTACVYVAYYNFGTNWFNVSGGHTNALGHPSVCSNDYNHWIHPTNATFGIRFTNLIGVADCNEYPTNQCSLCIHDPSDVRHLRCLEPWNPDLSNVVVATNVSVSSSGAHITNTSVKAIRNLIKIASDVSDELFRWAWLRGADIVTITNFISGSTTNAITNTTFWTVRPIGAAVSPSFSEGIGSPFPIYAPHIRADGTTNYFATDAQLTNLYVWTAGITNTPLQFPYAASNLFVSRLDAQALDVFFALTERYRVVNHLYPLPQWFFGNDDKSRLVDAKARVLQIAPNFAIKQYADSNGDFTAYCTTPVTGTNGGTNFISGGVTNISGYVTNTFYRDIPTWTGSKTQLCALLNLPSAVATVAVGSCNGTLAYGNYFDFTPDIAKQFTHTLPGLGHAVTNEWYLRDVWTTDTNNANMYTNQLALPFSGTSVFTGSNCTITVVRSVFTIVNSISDAIVTNCIDTNMNVYCVESGLSNGWPTHVVGGVRLRALYRTLTTTNSLTATNVQVLLDVNLSNSVNSLTVSNAVLYNYNVAINRHEIDYQYDGVRKCLDSFVWQVVPLGAYSADYTLTGRWSLASSGVSPGDLGVTAAVTNWSMGDCTGIVFVSETPTNPAYSQFTSLAWSVSTPTNCVGTQGYPFYFPMSIGAQWSKTVSNNPFTIAATPTIFLYSNNLDGTAIGFWGSCPPHDSSAHSSYHGVNSDYKDCIEPRTDSCSLVRFWTLIGPMDKNSANCGTANRAYAYGNCEPDEAACSGSSSPSGTTVVHNSGIALSSALVYPEAMNGFASVRELYAHSAMPDSSIQHITTTHGDLYNSNVVTSISTNTATHEENYGSVAYCYSKLHKTTAGNKTTFPNGAGCDPCDVWVTSYNPCCGGGAVWGGSQPTNCSARTDCVSGGSDTYDTEGAAWCSYFDGLAECMKITGNVDGTYAGGFTCTPSTISESCVITAYQTTDAGSGCGQGASHYGHHIDKWVLMGTANNAHAPGWEGGFSVDAYPLRTWDRTLYQDCDHRVTVVFVSFDSVTNLSITCVTSNFAALAETNFPRWAALDSGLQFDTNNRAGMYVRTQVQGLSTNSDIVLPRYISGDPARNATEVPAGYRVDKASGVIKWDQDATNGFRYHE